MKSQGNPSYLAQFKFPQPPQICLLVPCHAPPPSNSNRHVQLLGKWISEDPLQSESVVIYDILAHNPTMMILGVDPHPAAYLLPVASSLVGLGVLEMSVIPRF